MSLQPAATRLQELLGRPVKMAPDCIGPEVEAMKPAPGEVLLLENLRFHPEEEKNDPAFAKQLAALCDIYVNDAFGSAHRAHASTEGLLTSSTRCRVARFFRLMEAELSYPGMATTNPARPCVASLGGAKVSDKIEVIQNLGKVVDRLLIGGAMAYASEYQGLPTGKASLVEDDKVELGEESAGPAERKLLIPGGPHNGVGNRCGGCESSGGNHSPGMIGVDIGPKTIEAFAAVIAGCKTVIWNGPMGIFEKPPFDTGTVALAKAVAYTGAISVVGGGGLRKGD